LSLAHEIGHLIDHALGHFGVYSSYKSDSPISPVLRTIDQSVAVGTLRAVEQGNVEPEPGVNIRQIRYWLQPAELWARAYAQYVAAQTGNAELKRELQVAMTGKTSKPTGMCSGSRKILSLLQWQ
jgi:hypothetical protein